MKLLRSEKEIISSWNRGVGFPIVSIACIAYNHEAYIEDAIEGFLIQETDFPFEIVIHDDASTDKTAEIIKEYKKKYPSLIKIILQTENQYSKGVRPLFSLIPNSIGEFIALCEGDDYWVDRKKLQKQVDALKTTELDICIHSAFQFNVIKNKKSKKFTYSDNQKIIEGRVAVTSLNQFSPTASYLLRRSRFDTIPSWFLDAKDLPFSDYFIETLFGVKGVLYLPDTMSVYRRNIPGSYTSRSTRLSGSELIVRMHRVIKYTQKIKSVPGIRVEDVDQRISHIYKDYFRMSLKLNLLELYLETVDNVKYKNRFTNKLLSIFPRDRFGHKLSKMLPKVVRK